MAPGEGRGAQSEASEPLIAQPTSNEPAWGNVRTGLATSSLSVYLCTAHAAVVAGRVGGGAYVDAR